MFVLVDSGSVKALMAVIRHLCLICPQEFGIVLVFIMRRTVALLAHFNIQMMQILVQVTVVCLGSRRVKRSFFYAFV